ncbi:DNA adenine methylase [Pectobacterium phage POP12]|nr:DNA adenine methylase [Pectobacterium phage POP12]
MLGIIPYTGNKQELLGVLLSLFPEYSRFVDAFAGGLSVSLNVPGSVLSNDYDNTLIDMYEWLRTGSVLSDVLSEISTNDLDSENKEAYMQYRDKYNQNKTSLGLYVLLMHSFSNINRVNDEGEFNVPFGFRSLNQSTMDRLNHFKNHHSKITFSSVSFDELNILPDDFVYCDPPYLITDAAYNRLWSDEKEHELYAWLDGLDKRGVKFGLSNVVEHNGKRNDILVEWLKKYNVVELDKKYVLGQHSTEYEKNQTKEVYVCNYSQKPKFTLDDL